MMLSLDAWESCCPADVAEIIKCDTTQADSGNSPDRVAMQYRSRANPDQRRRRVLIDEKLADEGRVVKPAPSARRDARYSEDALSTGQPLLTDFLPSRSRSIAMVLLAALIVDVAIVALHFFREKWTPTLGEAVGVLDMSRWESLATLAITGHWVVAALVSVQILAIRRRRLDDFRGTYQVWIFALITSLWLILDSATAIRSLVALGISRIPSIPSLPSIALYHSAVVAIVLSSMFIRLTIEIRNSRPSQILLFLSALLAWTSQLLCHVPLKVPTVESSLLIGSSNLLSALLAISSLIAYGSYVKRDAAGEFVVRKKRKKKRKPEEDNPAEKGETEAEKILRVDPPSAINKPNSIGATISAVRSSTPAGANPEPGPLSKAERKALRR